KSNSLPWAANTAAVVFMFSPEDVKISSCARGLSVSVGDSYFGTFGRFRNNELARKSGVRCSVLEKLDQLRLFVHRLVESALFRVFEIHVTRGTRATTATLRNDSGQVVPYRTIHDRLTARHIHLLFRTIWQNICNRRHL